jgi:hypothetical protein
MIKRIFLIVIVYVAVVGIAAGCTALNNWGIRNLVERAGREGNPVIVISSSESTHNEFLPITSSVGLKIVDLHRRCFNMLTGQLSDLILAPSFSQNGTLVFWDRVKETFQFNTVSLSDLKLVKGAIITNEDVKQAPPAYLPLVPRTDSIFQRDGWTVSQDETNLILKDYATNTEKQISLSTIPVEMLTSSDNRYVWCTSPEGNVLYVECPVNNGKSPIWRLDIGSGQFVKIGEAQDIISYVSGPLGKILAFHKIPGIQGGVSALSNQVVTFCDGQSLQTLKEIQNAYDPVIGKKWAACVVVTPNHEYRIKVFDLESDWAETELYIPHFRMPGLLHTAYPGIALYEPPSPDTTPSP